MADLDQSGRGYRRVLVWAGPSIGLRQCEIQPQTIITAASYTLVPGDGIILLNLAGVQTVNLPSVSAWVNDRLAFTSNPFEEAVWIKDFGGNAAASNKTVHPFGSDTIDALAIDFTIGQNRQLLRLYPMNDLTGWISG
jgi:hypothetical protein